MLAEAFGAQGWVVWWDREIRTGQVFDKVIQKAIDEASCIVVLWSSSSIESDWVRVEADEGKGRNALVPVLIEEVQQPLAFRRVQEINLVGWNGNQQDPVFCRLLTDIEAIVRGGDGLSGDSEVPSRRDETPSHAILKNESAPAEPGPPIKVGILHSRTGTLSTTEKPVIDATVFAFEELNASGGILGRRIEWVIEDGASDENVFRERAEKLIVEDGVATIFGCWASSGRKAVKEVVEAHNHLLLYPEQYEGLEQSPNIVYLGPAPNQQYLWALKYLIGMKELEKVFLVGSDYIYPRAAAAVMRDEIERRGAEVVGEEYIPLDSFDVAEVVQKIVEAQPEIIFNQIVGETNLAFFKCLRKRGIKTNNIPTISTALTVQELGQLGSDLIAGDYSCWSYFMEIDSPENRDFVSRFHARHGSTVVISDPMAAAYFGVKLWAQAVEAAETDEPAAILEQLLHQSYDAPEGPVEIDPETHHTKRISRLAEIQPDGSFKVTFRTQDPVKPKPYPKTRTREEWDALVHDFYEGWGGRWAPEVQEEKDDRSLQKGEVGDLPTSPSPIHLLTPGATSVPEEVAQAGSWPMISHRGPAFSKIMMKVLEGLPDFFQTSHEIFCFPATETGGMEASVANLFSTGDRVATVSAGVFGDRFIDVAEAFGLDVERIEFSWGQAADPEIVSRRLEAMADIRAVHLTHIETSTGVKHDLPGLIAAVRVCHPTALIIVDASGSLGCVDLPMDALGIDVMYAGSHKGWLCPPGLMLIAVGPRARVAERSSRLPSFYWDFARTRDAYARLVPPYGASVTLWYQLDVALTLLRAEGRVAICQRHEAVAQFVRERVDSMGLEVYGDPAHLAETLTVLKLPHGLDLNQLEESEGVVFSGGQDRLEGHLFRIGHFGAVQIRDLELGLDALARQLKKLGH